MLIFLGISLAGVLAHDPGTYRPRHRASNILDPGYRVDFPLQQQVDVLANLI